MKVTINYLEEYSVIPVRVSADAVVIPWVSDDESNDPDDVMSSEDWDNYKETYYDTDDKYDWVD